MDLAGAATSNSAAKFYDGAGSFLAGRAPLSTWRFHKKISRPVAAGPLLLANCQTF
jgi:hypothetical protein